MILQQVVWITLVSVVIVTGFPLGSSDPNKEAPGSSGINYEEYLRQLEKKHKLVYNDIDQPWLPVADDSQESDEFVLIGDSLGSSTPPTSQPATSSQPPLSVSSVTTVTPTTERGEASIATDDQSQLATDDVKLSSPLSEIGIESTTVDTVTDPVEESTNKPVDTTIVAEGTDQSLTETTTEDEGSGLSTTLSFDVGNAEEGSGLSTTESVDTTTSILEILTTIQGETSTTTDDSSTDYPTVTTIAANQLLLKSAHQTVDGVTETAPTTLEPAGESVQSDGADEKEAKSSDSPKEETTEIQSTQTEQTTQGDESTIAVTSDLTVYNTPIADLNDNNTTTEPVTLTTANLMDTTVVQENTTAETSLNSTTDSDLN